EQLPGHEPASEGRGTLPRVPARVPLRPYGTDSGHSAAAAGTRPDAPSGLYPGIKNVTAWRQRAVARPVEAAIGPTTLWLVRVAAIFSREPGKTTLTQGRRL